MQCVPVFNGVVFCHNMAKFGIMEKSVWIVFLLVRKLSLKLFEPAKQSIVAVLLCHSNGLHELLTGLLTPPQLCQYTRQPHPCLDLLIRRTHIAGECDRILKKSPGVFILPK